MSGQTRTQHGGPAERPAVERRDVPAGRTALLLAALIGALLLVCTAVALMLILFDHRAPPIAPRAPASLTPPEPRLQPDEAEQRDRLARKTALPSAQIEAAMRRTVARGWEGGR